MANVSLNLARAAFGTLATMALLLAAKAPLNGWDMVAYIGAIRYYEEKDPAEIHRWTYEQVRAGVPDADYRKLVPEQPSEEGEIAGDATYRMHMAQDPKAFVEQMSYYQIRPLYTFPAYLLNKAGLNAVMATHIVAGAAVAIGLVLLYFICAAVLPAPLVLLAAPAAVLVGTLDLARRASPDGLSFCTVMLLAYLFVTKRTRALLIALPLAIAARTDLILFTFPFLVLLAFHREMRKGAVAASFVASVAMFKLVNTIWSNPGWATTFVHSFIERQHYPVSAPPEPVTISQYFDVMLNMGILSTHWTKPILQLYFIVAGCSVYLIWERFKQQGLQATLGNSAVTLAIASAAYVSGHFVIFPAWWERYFSGVYMVAIVALLWMLAQRIASSTSARRAPSEDFHAHTPVEVAARV